MKVCRLCGSSLSNGETRCSYCGTTTEDYVEPKRPDTTTRSNQSYRNQGSAPRYTETIQTTTSHSTSAHGTPQRTSTTSRTVIVEHYTPPRKKEPKGTAVFAIAAAIIIFSIIFVAVIFSFIENFDMDVYDGSSLIALSQEAARTYNAPELSYAEQQLGDAVPKKEGLYDNGVYTIKKIEMNGYSYDADGESIYEQNVVYLYFDLTDLQEGSSGNTQTSFRFEEPYDTDNRISIYVSEVVYEERLDYHYISDNNAVATREKNVRFEDAVFEVYKIKSKTSVEYVLYSEDICDYGIKISIEGSKDFDYLDYIKHVSIERDA